MSLSKSKGKSFQEEKEKTRFNQGVSEAYALNCGGDSCPLLDTLASLNRKRRSFSRGFSVLEESSESQQAVSMHGQVVNDSFDMMEMRYVVPEEPALQRFGMHIVKMPAYAQA